jgi:hypothetical protein
MKTDKDNAKIAQLARDFGIAENIVECIWDLGQSRGWEDGYKEGCVDNSQMDTLNDEGVQQTI